MPVFSFAIQLRFEESENLVYVDLAPSFGSPLQLSAEALKSELAKAGYDAFFFLSEGADELIAANKELCEQCQQTVNDYIAHRLEPTESSEEQLDSAPKKATEAKKQAELEAEALAFIEGMGMEYPSFAIAERRNGVVLIETDEDDLTAFASFIPPYGGKPATSESLLSAIKAASIKSGLLKDAIATAAERANKEGKPIAIAQGRKPVKGKNAEFERLVESLVCSGPKEDDHGIVNYRDINEFVLVEPGTPLMKRIAPLPGTPGEDVYGRPIPAPKGDLLPFSPKVTGAEVSKDDPNLLVATVKGHPVIFPNGISIDPALVLKNVSLATGNIDFDGAVHVKEDVADGMTIKANGEVVVNGVVGKATIIASGNVVIDQGLIGGMHSEEAKSDHQYGAEIHSGGFVSARFVTCAKIKAKGNIEVAEYISHSELEAGDSVLVGQSRGKGQLIGGYTQAGNRVMAKILGTKGSVPTTIRVGASADTVPRLRAVMQKIRKIEQDIGAIQETLQSLSTRMKLAPTNEASRAKVAELNERQNSLQIEKQQLGAQEKKLQSLLVKSKAALVSANQMIYTNVWVHILHTGKKMTEDMGGGKFRFEARQTIVEK